MKASNEEDRLAKRLAVVERDNERLRAGPPPDACLPGCGDHSCLVNPAKGIGTNGGCRCGEPVLRRMVSWQKREIARLRAVEQEHKAAREALRKILEISSDRERFVAQGPQGWFEAEQIARAALGS